MLCCTSAGAHKTVYACFAAFHGLLSKEMGCSVVVHMLLLQPLVCGEAPVVHLSAAWERRKHGTRHVCCSSLHVQLNSVDSSCFRLIQLLLCIAVGFFTLCYVCGFFCLALLSLCCLLRVPKVSFLAPRNLHHAVTGSSILVCFLHSICFLHSTEA